ncbi:Uncharacterised protein [Ralstonia mannitolilytica]|uniref:Uncharacterized protein n=1 Tax=Ralstonia mannitolilytica TaxID=105219 RepID=A0AAJ4ZN17_9RALS|nr:hypothetical protein LMG6866_02719 [Ralstonia mannitolilytica]CAJ0723753.1 hypothetical protein R77592_00087 [Ralstonia mannitolilytica]SUD88579.1 Uncharacterised protein [Ralstonia mannitolilytica]SUD94542.1 Uncharacterised protein [Ralstonia mannitolilytica]SUD98239.1 Uncharacterised protein [Ralstonia mannitolilytica]
MSLAAPAAMDMTKTPAASAGRGFSFRAATSRPRVLQSWAACTLKGAGESQQASTPMLQQRRRGPCVGLAHQSAGARDVPAKPSCSWRPASWLRRARPMHAGGPAQHQRPFDIRRANRQQRDRRMGRSSGSRHSSSCDERNRAQPLAGGVGEHRQGGKPRYSDRHGRSRSSLARPRKETKPSHNGSGQAPMLGACPLYPRFPHLDRILYGTEAMGASVPMAASSEQGRNYKSEFV